MKLCASGHENPDDASNCVECGLLLPGHAHRYGADNPPPHPKVRDIQNLSRAKEWVKDAGLEWDDVPSYTQDQVLKAVDRRSSAALVTDALHALGQLKPKPRAGIDNTETIVVEITAESVEALERSLKVLRRLSHAQPG